MGRTDFFYRAEEIVIQRGWSVFPVSRETKTPCLKGGRNLSTVNLDLVMEWGEQFPCANVGVPTGRENGIFVLDFDRAGALNDLRRFGQLFNTLTATSGRGTHMYFQYTGAKVVNRAGKLVKKAAKPWLPDQWIDIEGLDVRGDGGSIIAPPSIHASGRQYYWLDGCDVVKLPPPWLVRMIGEKCEARVLPLRRQQEAPPALGKSVDIVLMAKEGGRNHALNAAAYLARLGVRAGAFHRDEAVRALVGAAVSIGLSREEAKKTVESGLNAK